MAGKKVVISPEWIQNVSWTDSTMYVELTRGAIKNAPRTMIDRGPIDRDYEARLHQHYGRQGYWIECYGGLKQALKHASRLMKPRLQAAQKT